MHHSTSSSRRYACQIELEKTTAGFWCWRGRALVQAKVGCGRATGNDATGVEWEQLPIVALLRRSYVKSVTDLHAHTTSSFSAAHAH